MSMVNTGPSELGTAVADAVREAMSRATSGVTVAGYIERQPPVRWEALSDAGWDLVGVVDDDESATLRDLVEIAGAWGETLIQLPLMTTILAKRHSAAAARLEGPATFSVPVASLPDGVGFVPFGQVPGISLVTSFAGDGTTAELTNPDPVDFAPSLLGATSPVFTEFTDQARREIAVVAAAEAAGIVRRAVVDAVEFTKGRQQFGKAIGSFQAVKHLLANAHIAAETAETSALWASLEPDRSAQAVRQSFRESMRSIRLSAQVYGGLGFTWEMDLHFLLRHIIALRELANGLDTGREDA